MIKVEVDFKPILETLKKLPEKMQKDMLHKALLAGSKVVVSAAEKRVPIGRGKGGDLILSLKAEKKKTSNPMLAVYRVKFSQSGGVRGKGYHSHLIEFGHKIWRRKKRGRGSVAATGKKYEMEPTGKSTRPHPMLRPAFFSNTQKIINKVAEELSVTKIERQILRKLRTRARVVAKRG